MGGLAQAINYTRALGQNAAERGRHEGLAWGHRGNVLVSWDGGLWQMSLQVTADGEKFEQCVMMPRAPGPHVAVIS